MDISPEQARIVLKYLNAFDLQRIPKRAVSEYNRLVSIARSDLPLLQLWVLTSGSFLVDDKTVNRKRFDAYLTKNSKVFPTLYRGTKLPAIDGRPSFDTVKSFDATPKSIMSKRPLSFTKDKAIALKFATESSTHKGYLHTVQNVNGLDVCEEISKLKERGDYRNMYTSDEWLTCKREKEVIVPKSTKLQMISFDPLKREYIWKVR